MIEDINTKLLPLMLVVRATAVTLRFMSNMVKLTYVTYNNNNNNNNNNNLKRYNICTC